MHITLDGGDEDFALGLQVAKARLLRLDIGDQMRYRLFHDARTFYHLRQKHFAGTKQIADHVHAVHQRPFNHVDRTPAGLLQRQSRLFGVFGDPLRDAVHQRMREALADGFLPPFQILFFSRPASLQRAGDFDHTFGRIGTAVQHHVLDALAQLGGEIVIHANHAGVDDAHGHAGLDRVIQKYRVDRLARRIVTAERKADVGHATAHLGMRQVLTDPAGGLDEIDGVVVVFLDARRNGKNIRIKNNIFGREAGLLYQ